MAEGDPGGEDEGGEGDERDERDERDEGEEGRGGRCLVFLNDAMF